MSKGEGRSVRPDPLSEAEKQPLLKDMTPKDEQICKNFRTISHHAKHVREKSGLRLTGNVAFAFEVEEYRLAGLLRCEVGGIEFEVGVGRFLVGI